MGITWHCAQVMYARLGGRWLRADLIGRADLPARGALLVPAFASDPGQLPLRWGIRPPDNPRNGPGMAWLVRGRGVYETATDPLLCGPAPSSWPTWLLVAVASRARRWPVLIFLIVLLAGAGWLGSVRSVLGNLTAAWLATRRGPNVPGRRLECRSAFQATWRDTIPMIPIARYWPRPGQLRLPPVIRERRTRLSATP